MKDRSEYYKQRYNEQKAQDLAAKLQREKEEAEGLPTPPRVIPVIEQTLNHPGSQFITARSRWRRLPDEDKREVIQGFERHRRACHKIGIAPEPSWIVETLAIKFNSQP